MVPSPLLWSLTLFRANAPEVLVPLSPTAAMGLYLHTCVVSALPAGVTPPGGLVWVEENPPRGNSLWGPFWGKLVPQKERGDKTPLNAPKLMGLLYKKDGSKTVIGGDSLKPFPRGG